MLDYKQIMEASIKKYQCNSQFCAGHNPNLKLRYRKYLILTN